MNFRAADFKTHYFGIRLNIHHTVLLQDNSILYDAMAI